jgi:hypothetical protein
MNRNADIEFMSKAQPADAIISDRFAATNQGAFSKQFFEATQGAIDPREFAKFLLKTASKPSTSIERTKALTEMAKELIQEADVSLRANLADSSTRRFKNAGQPGQKNARSAQSGLANLLGLGKETTTGDMGRHGRFCQDNNGRDIQGRNCAVCHGIGFHAFAQKMAKQRATSEPESVQD